MKHLKKWLAGLMIFTMMIGIMPMNAIQAWAAEPIVVVAGSDYQAGDSSSTLQTILKTIKKDYPSAHGALFCGDYSSGYSSDSDVKKVSNDVKAVYSSMDTANHVFVQGNHDANVSTNGSTTISTTGAHDTEHYGVYVINYSEFNNSADKLGTYLDAKVKENYKKPIFVLTHVPLHANSRGDNGNAKSVYDKLDAAGEAGLNIIFMFGHNHSGGYDAYLGNGSIYLKKGDSISVASGSSKVNDTLNFTYMNAGYIGYINGQSDKTLTMTAFEITDNQVTVKRYDKNGQHNLKAAGANVNGYTADSNVYGSAVINLANGQSTISALDGNIGGGTVSGNTVDITATKDGETVNKTISVGSTLVINLTSGSNNEKDYTITNSNSAVATLDVEELTIAGSGTGQIVVTGAKAGTTTITATAASGYQGSYTATINLTVTNGTTQPEEPDNTDAAYKKVTALEVGKQYLIVAKSSSGSSYALTNDASNLKTKVTPDGDTVILDGDASDLLWTVEEAAGEVADGGEYVLTNNGTAFGRTTSSNAVGLENSEIDYHFGHSVANGTLYNLNSAGNRYYLGYSNSTFNYSTTNANNITLYEKVGSQSTDPDDDTTQPEQPGGSTESVVYTLDTNGIDAGAEYLIVSEKSGNAYALKNPGGSSAGASMGATAVTIKNGSTIETSATDIVWTATANGEGFDLTNDGDYLEGKSGEVKIYSSQQYPARSWTYEDDQLKHTGGSNTYVVYYNNGFTSTYNGTEEKVYFFKKGTDSTTQPEQPGQPGETPDDTDADYKKVTALEVGKQYVIVAKSSGSGSTYALTNDANSLKTKVTVENDTVIISGSDANLLWTVEAATGKQEDGGEFVLTNNGIAIKRVSQQNTVALEAASDSYYFGLSVAKETLANKSSGGSSYYLGYGSVSGNNEYTFRFATATTDNITFYEKVKSEGGDTPHVHDYKAVVTAPTCTEAGYTTHTCTCGESYTDTPVAALGHAWDKGTVTKEPTETTTGIRTYECTVCDETKTETIPALGHTHKYTSKVTEPTCTEAGYTAHTCTCGESYTDTPVAALGHAWDKGTVTKEPTETTTGIRTYECAVCDETKTETIPALGHTHKYTSKVTEPTCEDAGYTTYTCTCGDSYTDNEVPAKGHTEVVQKGTPASCMTAGITDGKTCSVCKEVLVAQTEIPATGHNEVIDPAIPATCTEPGYTDGSHCGACGTLLKIQREVAPLGHTWDEGVVTKQPTETEEGILTLTCTVCKETTTEPIPVLGHVHSYSAVVTNPTCEEEGYTTYTCTCGHTYTDNTVSAKGHSYGEPSWEWSTDNMAATATFTCTRTACGVSETVIAEVTVTETDDMVVYTAVCEFNETEYEAVKEVEIEKPALPFTDVRETSWYYDAVKYVYDNGIMNGLTATTFGPNETLDRAMFATILYRLSGSPEVEFKDTFTDVKNGRYYSDAVIWAYENGVITGYGNGLFGPSDKITREQMVVMMYRYAKLMNYDLGEMADYSSFPDAEKVSNYAKEAMSWAIGNGIINGKASGSELLLDPQGNALRAECAAIIMRFEK